MTRRVMRFRAAAAAAPVVRGHAVVRVCAAAALAVVLAVIPPRPAPAAAEPLTLERARELALSRSSALAKAGMTVQSRVLAEKTAAINALPAITLSATGGATAIDAAGNPAAEDTAWAGVSADAAYTIWDGGKAALNRASAGLDTEDARQAALAERYAALAAVDAAYYAALKAADSLDNAAASLASAERSLAIMEIKQESGVASRVDYLSARKTALSADKAFHDARLDLARKRAELTALIGDPGAGTAGAAGAGTGGARAGGAGTGNAAASGDGATASGNAAAGGGGGGGGATANGATASGNAAANGAGRDQSSWELEPLDFGALENLVEAAAALDAAARDAATAALQAAVAPRNIDLARKSIAVDQAERALALTRLDYTGLTVTAGAGAGLETGAGFDGLAPTYSGSLSFSGLAGGVSPSAKVSYSASKGLVLDLKVAAALPEAALVTPAKRDAGIASSRFALEQAARDYAAARTALDLDVETNVIALVNYARQTLLARETEDFSKLYYELSEELFHTGQKNVRDYADDEQAYREDRQARIDAQYNVLKTVLAIQTLGAFESADDVAAFVFAAAGTPEAAPAAEAAPSPEAGRPMGAGRPVEAAP